MVKLSNELVEVIRNVGFEVKDWDGKEPEP
jgi:hypothetical protein